MSSGRWLHVVCMSSACRLHVACGLDGLKDNSRGKVEEESSKGTGKI